MSKEGGPVMNIYRNSKRSPRGSSYERRPFIEELKRGLNRSIRRKLAEAEEPPTTIGE